MLIEFVKDKEPEKKNEAHLQLIANQIINQMYDNIILANTATYYLNNSSIATAE